MNVSVPKPVKRVVVRYPSVSAMTLFVCLTILVLQIIALTKG